MLTEGLVLKRQEKLWSSENFDSYPCRVLASLVLCLLLVLVFNALRKLVAR